MYVYIKTLSKLAFLVLVIILTGCKNTSENSAAELSQISTFAENYTAAWNSQNPESVASFFSSEGTLSVNNDPPLEGRNAITNFAKGFMIAFPDMNLIMDSLIVKSDRTEYYWTFSGTNAGPKGTCNFVRFSGVEKWQFDNKGLIKHSKGSYDAEEYKHQVEYGIEE